MSKKHFKKGERVAHKEVDGETGSAYTGVVFDTVGDEEQELVLIRTEEGEIREAYDGRELVSLGKKQASQGPVILKKRHITNLLRLRSVRLALMLEFVLIALFVAASIVWDFSAEEVGMLAVVVLLLATAVFILLQKEVSQRQN